MLTHANHRQVRDFILQYPKMDFTPVTLSMVLRDLVAKVIDLVGELFLRLRSLRPLTVIKDPATTFAAQIEQGSNIVSVISRLQRFQRLDPALFEEYKTQLEKTHPEVVLDTDFLTLREVTTDEKIPQLFDIDDQGNKQKSLVLIPLVLEGALENHIVLLAYDVKNKIAYYYDSKGKPIRASQERCLAGSTFTLGYFIEERFKDTYVNAEVLYENTQKHQWNCTDCGVYVFQKMQMLIERLNPVLNPPNKAENPNLNGCPELISRNPVPGSSAEARTEIIEILSKKDNE